MSLSLKHSKFYLILLYGLMSRVLCQNTHNCDQEYSLRMENSCLRSSNRTSQDSYTNCSNLSSYLGSFNRQVTDCLQLFFEPGYYEFDNSIQTITYNLVLTGQDGVIINCSDVETTTGDSEYVIPLTFTGEFVVMEKLSFLGCNRPLQFKDLQSVSITNSTFRDYTGSAVDLFNVVNITVHNCHFENCISTISKPKYHGNSGAISVGFNSDQTTNTLPAFTTVTSSTFIENRALVPPSLSATQLQNALNNNIYHGRGGALGVFVQETKRNVTVLIEDNVFFNNSADSFGGAVYLIIGGSNTTHLYEVHSNNFTSNGVIGEESYGGAIQLSLLNQNNAPSVYKFTNCHFEANYGQQYGGGFTSVQVYSQGAGNQVTVSGCTFVRNRALNAGSAIMFASFLYVQNRFESHHYLCQNNTFLKNTASGGAFTTAHINVNFQGHNRFEYNEGPGLSVVGSQIEVLSDARISFIGNDASNSEGGALYLQDFGQVMLHPGSALEFINNTGRIGSAIVVDVQRSSPVFSQLVFNPQCFLVYENSTRSPEDWEDVSITFSGNRASVGPALYISHLDHCSWQLFSRDIGTSNQINVTFSIEEIPNWPVFQFTNKSNEATSFQDHSYSSEFYFQTEPVNISSANSSKAVSIRPGERGRLNLLSIDQFGNPAYVILRLSDLRSPINTGAFSQAGTASRLNNNTDSGSVQFEPSLLPMLPSDQYLDIVYGFQNFSVELFLEDENLPIIIDTPYNIRSTEQYSFNLSLVPCKPGFELDNTTVGDGLVSCLCVRDEYYLLDCEDDVLILFDGFWGAEEREPLPHLDLTPCPATYCQCYYRNGSVCETLFFQTDPTLSLQCHPLRNGTLCGRCINGTGVGVLRTTCRDCGNSENYFVIGLLIVVDVVVVSLILLLTVKFHMIFPSSLKGFLFYVQTVYYTTEYFPISFWNVRRYMLFVSSAIGLYFPWDFCLFPTMSPLVSFSPKFTPAAIATLVSATAITIVYVTRSRDGREYIWHGVWTLILLLYAPLFHTCASLLHCRYTPNAQGSEESYHWYLDGEVECFQDPAHIALGLVAVFVLMVLVLLVPAVFLFTMCASSKMVQSKSRTVGWVYAALTAGYRESWEARMYSSFELVRRLLLIGMAVVLPGRSVSNLYVLLNVLAVHLFFKPYSKIWHNVLEACVLLLYTLLLSIRSTPTFVESISPYSGTGVPEDWNGDLTRTDSVTWLLFPFYYLPLVLAVVFIIGSIIYLVVKHFTGKKNVYKGVKKFSRKIKSIHISTENSTKRSSDYSDTVFGLDDLTTTLAQ